MELHIYEWLIYLFDILFYRKKYFIANRLFCTRKYKRHTFKKAYKFLIDIYLACFFCLTIFCPWFFHIFRASFPILEIYFLFNLLFIQIWKIQDFSKIPIFGMKFEWSQISFLSQFKRIFTEIPMMKDLKKIYGFLLWNMIDFLVSFFYLNAYLPTILEFSKISIFTKY